MLAALICTSWLTLLWPRLFFTKCTFPSARKSRFYYNLNSQSVPSLCDFQSVGKLAPFFHSGRGERGLDFASCTQGPRSGSSFCQRPSPLAVMYERTVSHKERLATIPSWKPLSLNCKPQSATGVFFCGPEPARGRGASATKERPRGSIPCCQRRVYSLHAAFACSWWASETAAKRAALLSSTPLHESTTSAGRCRLPAPITPPRAPVRFLPTSENQTSAFTSVQY